MTKNIKGILLVLQLLLSSQAWSGVDQGNPKPGARYFNMKNNFTIGHEETMRVKLDSPADKIKIEVIPPYNQLGYFLVAKEITDQIKNICGIYKIKNSEVSIYWIGKDCEHIFLKRKFEWLKNNVRYVRFSN